MNTFFKSAFFAAALCCAHFLTAQANLDPTWAFIADQTNSDQVIDFWVNPEGESYIAGSIGFTAGNPNLDGFMITKTDTDGNEVWRHLLYGPTTDWRVDPECVVGDEQGNIFVVFNETFRYTDMTNVRLAVHKYAPDGTLLWSNHYTPQQDGPMEGAAWRSAVYKNNTLYFAASSTTGDSSADMDAMIVKINGNDGTLIQKIIFDSQYHTDDFFRQLRVADNGDVWAIGRSRGYMYPGGLYSHYDANVVKYDANGVFQWEHRENGTSNTEDFGINLDIDASGNCYASNQLRHIGVGQRRVHIQKLSPSGAVLWSYEYQGSSSGYTWRQPVSVLPNGNVAAVVSNENGIVTMLIDGSTGAQLWMTNYNRDNMGSANHQRDMITDAFGNIYVTGVSRDNTPFGAGYDMITIKYDSAGNLVWLSNFNRANYATTGDDGVGLMLDGSGNLYAIGWTVSGEDYNNDFLLLKYGNQSLGVAQNDWQSVKVYPNPAADILHVQFPTHTQNVSDVSLIDTNGRVVRSWNSRFAPDQPLALDLNGISPAMYLLTVNTDAGVYKTKVVKCL